MDEDKIGTSTIVAMGVLVMLWPRGPLCNVTALGCFILFSDWSCVLCLTDPLPRDQAELPDLNGRWKIPERICSLILYPRSVQVALLRSAVRQQ